MMRWGVRLFREGSMLKERGRQVPVVDLLSPGPKFSYLSVRPLLPTMETESLAMSFCQLDLCYFVLVVGA